jgi:hypothetical protein
MEKGQIHISDIWHGTQFSDNYCVQSVKYVKVRTVSLGFRKCRFSNTDVTWYHRLGRLYFTVRLSFLRGSAQAFFYTIGYQSAVRGPGGVRQPWLVGGGTVAHDIIFVSLLQIRRKNCISFFNILKNLCI